MLFAGSLLLSSLKDIKFIWVTMLIKCISTFRKSRDKKAATTGGGGSGFTRVYPLLEKVETKATFHKL
jgi:hypothetical protein